MESTSAAGSGGHVPGIVISDDELVIDFPVHKISTTLRIPEGDDPLAAPSLACSQEDRTKSPASPLSDTPPAKCPQCGKKVKTKPIECPRCSTLYHENCTFKTAKLDDGSFAKCCGGGSTVLSAQEHSKLVEDISARVASEVAKQIAIQMSQQLDAVVVKHVDGLRTEVKRDLATIRQSISDLRITTKADYLNENEVIKALETRG